MACVLIVEDETQVLMLAESVLQQAGHDTLSAATVAEAQAIIINSDEKFALRSGVNSFFVEVGAMNFIEKSAIATNEYWLRVYRSCPNFAQ